jgi:hypothetical protein
VCLARWQRCVGFGFDQQQQQQHVGCSSALQSMGTCGQCIVLAQLCTSIVLQL